MLLLERSERVGGCLRTEEITAPGSSDDVMATTLVLFVSPSPAYGAIGKDLEARGFKVAQSGPADWGVLAQARRIRMCLFSRDRDR